MKLSKYAKINGISYITAYRYFHNGMIKGKQMPTGTILIDDDASQESNNKSSQCDEVVVYARVSSSENKGNLDKQAERLTSYANAKGYKVSRVVKEVGSGLNDNRRQLAQLLANDNVKIILVEHKDRLCRFGLNYISLLLEKQGRKIEIINDVDNAKDDLMQDFVSIITSFCARLYGQRRTKRKTEQIINCLSSNNDQEK